MAKIGVVDRESGQGIDPDALYLSKSANASIPLTPQNAPPTHVEGLLWYDNVDKCLTVFNDEAEVSQCIGREIYARVYNGTGSDITNGKLVYISGAFSGRPTISLASANTKDTSRFLGMATHDIETACYETLAANAPSSSVASASVMGLINNITGSLAYYNGAEMTAKNGGIATVDNGFTLFTHASAPWTGYGTEVIAINGAITTTERQKLERNQGKFYGIAVQ